MRELSVFSQVILSKVERVLVKLDGLMCFTCVCHAGELLLHLQ